MKNLKHILINNFQRIFTFKQWGENGFIRIEMGSNQLNIEYYRAEFATFVHQPDHAKTDRIHRRP